MSDLKQELTCSTSSQCLACIFSPGHSLCFCLFTFAIMAGCDWQLPWFFCTAWHRLDAVVARWTVQCLRGGLVQSDFSTETSSSRTCSRLWRWLVSQMPDVRNRHRRHILWLARSSSRSRRGMERWRSLQQKQWTLTKVSHLAGATADGKRQPQTGHSDVFLIKLLPGTDTSVSYPSPPMNWLIYGRTSCCHSVLHRCHRLQEGTASDFAVTAVLGPDFRNILR